MSSSDWSPFLNLIRPDFAAALRGDVHAIVIVVFFLLIVTFTVGTVIYVLRARREAISVVTDLDSITADLSSTNVDELRNEIRRKARELGGAGELWREFDETLVATPGGKVWNTVEAEHYFSGDRIAPKLLTNRLLSTMPAVLTALGLLGTFIGLAVGLDGLNLTESSDADEMRESVGSLVTGVSLGFTASVWGVFTSVLVNGLEKWAARDVSRRIVAFRGKIDEIFVQRSPEHSLVLIEQYTQDSATALSTLHEKIGAKLQEAVTGLSDELQTALTRAIESAVAPSMNALAERTTSQSAQVFEDLVEKFTESFRGIGARQAAELGSASATLETALTGVSDRVGAAVTSMQEAAAAQAAATAAQTESQARRFAAQEEAFRAQVSQRTEAFESEMSVLTELVTSQAKILDGSLSAITVGMDAVAGKLGEATNGLQRSSEVLGSTSRTFEATSRRLDESFEAGTAALVGTADAHQQAANLLDRHTAELERLTETTATTAGKLLTAAQSANSSFDTLRASQRQFLDDLQQRVENQSATLREWLDAYGEKVHHQTRDRLETWDKHTRDFAAHMLQVSQALAEVVDEVEVKQREMDRA